MAEYMDNPDALTIEICSIDRAPYSMEVNEAAMPGVKGLFVVLPGHAPLFSALEPGILSVKNAREERRHFAIGSGLARVLDNQIIVLTRTAELGADIDAARAESAKKRAEDRLRSERNKIDVERAEASLSRARIRLETLKKSGMANA